MVTIPLASILLLSPAAFSQTVEPVSEGAFFFSLEGFRAFAHAAPQAAANDEDALLDRTRDRDSGVRREAARALKAYAGVSDRVRQRLVEMVKDSSEDAAVKSEAVKSLSVAAGGSDVRDLLIDLAKGRGDGRLRGIACKALYWWAPSDSGVRDALQDLARKDPVEVRKAALWALFAAAGDSGVRDLLLEAGLKADDALVRSEALKSLYGAMNQSDVRDAARKIARDRSEKPAPRYTAILLLVNRFEDADTKLLQEIAKDDPDPTARRAALVALGDRGSEQISRFFHLVRRDWRYPYPVVHDPLDDE